jgi:hypothetical protein
MRLVLIAAAAGFLLIPAAGPAAACSGPALHSSNAVSVDLAAATKKMKKKKKEKVEYMRAVPAK